MIPELIVFFTAMTPFLEIKLAIPVGMELGLSATSTFLFSVAGTIIPIAIILAIIGPFSDFLRKKSQFMDKFFKNLFNKTRKEHSKKFKRYGTIFLIIFVAIPLPGSGAGTGALISFIFGVDYWKSLNLIFLGTLIAGILLTAGFGSIFAILDLFT
jgi:uncharacterized membrane protein